MIRLKRIHSLALLFCLLSAVARASAQENPPAKPRARDLGVPFDGTPGPLNAITDVPGVTVGHTTLVSGEGKLEVGKGPVRTGVTAVLPRGKDSMSSPVFAGWWSLNGNGEMTGTTWVEESGFLDGPVMITNAHGQPDPKSYWWALPVVAETWDGWLNDINGFHVKPEHAFHAIDSAHAGPVEEGNVGGGTGMVCNGFKGGIGTSSRKLVAHQLKRLARRVSLGLGRNGSISGNGSGDIFIAFSTANPGAAAADHVVDLKMLPNDRIEVVFAATVQATEEAIINAMVAAETMTGIENHKVIALPHEKLREVLKKYNRLAP